MGNTIKNIVRKYDLVLVLIVILVITAIFKARAFYSLRNMSSILKLSALVGIATLGESLVLLIRGVDISVGAMMGFTSLLAALLLQAEYGIGVPE